MLYVITYVLGIHYVSIVFYCLGYRNKSCYPYEFSNKFSWIQVRMITGINKKFTANFLYITVDIFYNKKLLQEEPVIIVVEPRKQVMNDYRYSI